MLTQYREKVEKMNTQIERYKIQCENLRKCLDENQTSIKLSDRI